MNRVARYLLSTVAFFLFCLNAHLAQVTLTYSFTGSPQTFIVPPCVASLSLTAKGAKGGSNAQGIQGGLGGTAFGVLSVTPGDILTIYVGGALGYNGGGLPGTSTCAAAIGGVGGGASDVRLNGSALPDRVIIGGAGGGAGGNRVNACGLGTGGGGGGGYYGGGGGAGFPGAGYVLPTGGSQTTGGIGGVSTASNGFNGFAGSVGMGGAGGTAVINFPIMTNTNALSGGVGGGLIGGPGQYNWMDQGGENATNGCGSSGAGGSSYLGSLSNAYTIPGNNSGNGEVIISYTTTIFPMPLNLSQTYICTGGSATLSALGQTSYSWSTGSNAASIIVTPTINTTYSVTGTDSFGCISLGVITVTVDGNLPDVTVNSSANTVCEGNTVTLNGSGASSYTWSGGVNNGSPFVPLSTSSYTLIGSNGCGTNTAMVTVSVNPNPTLSVNPASVSLCAGISTTFTASGANSYSWTGGIINGASFIPAASNVYTVTGTNAFGCSGTATAAAMILPGPTVIPVASPATLCIGETATLAAGGASNYTWSPGGANSASVTVNPSVNAVYSLTQSIGSCVDIKTVSVMVVPLPTVTAVVSNTSICSGMAVVFSASGASSYSWTGNVQNGVPFSPSLSATYTVTGEDQYGCSDNVVVSVSVTPSPSVDPVASQTSICTGETVTLSATGASGYTWMPGNFNTSTVSVSPAIATSYTLVKQNGFCFDTKTIAIAVFLQPILQISGPSSICDGESITMTASGAQNYTWAPAGLFTSTIAITPQQSTTFSITGSNGTCTNSVVKSLTVFPNPVLSVTASQQAVCNGQPVTIVAGGGNSYTWTSPPSIAGVNSASVTVLPFANTVYAFTGENSFHCTSSASQSIQVLPLPALSVQASANAVCAGSVLVLSASGASGYTWSAPGGVNSAGPSYTLLPASTAVYTVSGPSITNSCVGTATVQAIVVIPNVSVSSPSAICAGESATLSAAGANSYTWSPNYAPFPFQTMYVAPASSTVYHLAATSLSAGIKCVSKHTVSLQVNALPKISISASNASVICVNEQFSLFASGALTYTWGGGQNSATLNVQQAQISKTYSVNGTSASGCVSNASVSVSVSECLGMEDISGNECRIYPNPSQGILYIQSEKGGHFSLYNDLGQVLRGFDVLPGKYFQITGLASGSYYLIGDDVGKPVRVVVVSEP